MNIIISTALIITIPIWIPALVLFVYLFQICIYNGESFHSSVTEKYYYHYNNPPRWFMCLRLNLILLLQIILALLRLTIAPLFMLILTGIVCAYGYIRYGLRTLYDAIMFRLITMFARSPVTDTSMAWKISGPGISDTYYQSIKSTDIYILVLAELEKLHLEIFRSEISKLLQKPQTDGNIVVQQVQREFIPNFYIQLPKQSSSINFFVNKLNIQINQRIQNYPSSPGAGVRFTE